MFFSKHPYITQKDKDGNATQVTDIFASIGNYDLYKNNQYSIQYTIREGDTPESIAKRVYDKQYYSWIILLVNGMKSVYTDWPLSSVAFDSMIKNKYSGLSSLFLKLDTITNYDLKKGDIITITNNSNTQAEIIDWNASLSKLTIKMKKGSFAINNNISLLGQSSILAKIGRIVQYEQESLHHFETGNNTYIDPLTGYLQGYINGVSNNVVTNYEYEVRLNDNKRFIYIPTPEIARRIEQQYSVIMAS